MAEPENLQQLPQSAQPGKKARLKMVLVVIVVAAVVGVLIAAIMHKSSTKKQASTAPTVAQVQITGTGFGPATLQVKAGTQVIWTNNDTKSHQVAADPYPKDNSIPNFNSAVVLGAHDTYAYTFAKAGTYTYHDERNPLKLKGTVIVQ